MSTTTSPVDTPSPKRPVRRRITAAVAAAVVALPLAAWAAWAATTPTVAVPAYFYPGALWDTMSSTPNVSLAVVNPASGPGTAADPAYKRAIDAARAKGIRVAGYVPTDYGRRTSVLADIATYKSFYGVVDVFLDETTLDCTSLATYRPWIDVIRANGGRVIANPGYLTASCWADAVDVLNVFEGTAATYATYKSASWMASYPPSKFWNIVYAVPAGGTSAVKAIAAAQGIGSLYATDDVLPNPFDRLPTEWSVLTGTATTTSTTTSSTSTSSTTTTRPTTTTTSTTSTTTTTRPATTTTRVATTSTTRATTTTVKAAVATTTTKTATTTTRATTTTTTTRATTTTRPTTTTTRVKVALTLQQQYAALLARYRAAAR